MSGEDYLQWHDGVEFDADSQTWRGYIEANGSTRKHLTEATFADKGQAVVAASDMLREARKGTVPGFAD
jgi:hypothetical protein